MTSLKRTVYSDLEKQVFLEILKRYKHIIEAKGTNCATLKGKSEAWTAVASEYNKSSLICTKRDVQQLRKYWSNLKQINKNILTAEKQSTFLTGGGPQQNIGEVDPNVLDVIPTLMTTAPTIASSNLSTQETADRQREVLKTIQPNNTIGRSKIQEISLISSSPIEVASNINIMSGILDNTLEIEYEVDNPAFIETESNNPSDIFTDENENGVLSDVTKTKRTNTNICSTAKKQKVDRHTLVCEKELELANIKISHEIDMCKLKKQREEFINKITMEKLLLEKKELQERLKLTKFRAQKEMGGLYVSDDDGNLI